MDELKKYVIVEFTDGIQIVPKRWIVPTLDQSYFPLVNSHLTKRKYDKMVIDDDIMPNNDWEKYNVINIMSSADDLQKCKERLRRVETRTDINTETDEECAKKNRKKRCARKIFDAKKKSPIKSAKKQLFSPDTDDNCPVLLDSEDSD